MTIFTLLTVTYIYWKTLFTYFAQDDFYLLLVSKARNIIEVFQFFLPRTDAVWYRPLSSHVFFFVSYSFFGLQPFFYHIIVFGTHLTACWLLICFVSDQAHTQKVGLLVGFIYGIYQIHTISLSWLSSYSFVLGPLWLILLTKFYFEKKYFKSNIIFLLGLLTTEVFIIYIPFLFCLELIFEKPIYIGRIIPFMLTGITVLLMRFVFFPTTISNYQYGFSLNLSILSNVKFYLFRLIGIPLAVEQMSWMEKIISLTSTSLIICICMYGGLVNFKNSSFRNLNKFVVVCLMLSIFGVLPFLPLTNHVAPYYLTFTLVGFAPLMALCLIKAQSRLPRLGRSIYWGLIIGILILTNIIGIEYTMRTHWIFRRAKMAQVLISQKNLHHPVGSEEYFTLGADAAEKFLR